MAMEGKKFTSLLVAALLATAALIPMAGVASSGVEIVSDPAGDQSGNGGDASDLVALKGATNATRLNLTLEVVDATDNPKLIQYRADFSFNGTDYTAKVSYQTDGDLVSAVLDENGSTKTSIDASRSGDSFTLSIERSDVGSPAQGDTITGVAGETRQGEDGDTFDVTDAGDYRIGNNAEPVFESIPEVNEGGEAADLTGLSGDRNTTHLEFTIDVVDISDNPIRLVYAVDFTHDGKSFTARVDYTTAGQLENAFVDNSTGAQPIQASIDGDSVILSIDKDHIDNPQDGDTLEPISAKVLRDADNVQIEQTSQSSFTLGDGVGAIVDDGTGDRIILEGDLIEFNVTATDADGDNVTLSASNLPSGASFNDTEDGDDDGVWEANFSWEPDFDQAGTYTIDVTASDGGVSTTESFTIEVDEATGVPEIEPIDDKSVDEGATLEFNVSATDPNGDDVTLDNATELPRNANFTDNGDPDGDGVFTGTFTFEPDFDQAGTYDVEFNATDVDGTVTEDLTITVNNVDTAPIIEPIANRTVEEGNKTVINLTAEDPEGDTVTWSVSDKPSGATFTDAGDPDDDGTYNATFEWQTDTSDAGTYTPNFTASDSVNTNTIEVGIEVTEIAAPVLDEPAEQFVDEGNSITVTLSASDPDNDPLTFNNTTALPDGASLSEDGTFSWTTDQQDAGTYDIGVNVSDGSLTDTGTLTITVLEDNGAPTIDGPDDLEAFETQDLLLDYSATDPDGDSLSFSVSGLPSGASFQDHGDGTASIDWTPNLVQSGTYTISVTVSDGSASDSTSVTVTVLDENPEFDLRIRDSNIGIAERATVIAEIVLPNSGKSVTGAQITVNASWTDQGESRFNQSHTTKTDRFGTAIINLDRDVAGLVNAPGEHTVAATGSFTVDGQTFDGFTGTETYRVS